MLFSSFNLRAEDAQVHHLRVDLIDTAASDSIREDWVIRRNGASDERAVGQSRAVVAVRLQTTLTVDATGASGTSCSGLRNLRHQVTSEL